MSPTLFDQSSWDLLWGLAALVGLAGMFRALRRLGVPVAAVLLLLAALPVATLIGAKALFLSEGGGVAAAWPPARGFRGPGGLLAAAGTLIGLCWWLGIPVRRTLDALAPSVVAVMAIGRLGCFLAGCCFGPPTALPWGLAFPAGSPAHASHAARHLIVESAPASLPVHPLALYFVLEALALLAVLRWLAPRAQYDGQVVLCFAVLHFWSKAGLETLRDGPMNSSGAAALGIAVAASILLVGVALFRLAPSQRLAPASAADPGGPGLTGGGG